MVQIDMDMPESCKKCRFNAFEGFEEQDASSYCFAANKHLDEDENEDLEYDRKNWCPLLPVLPSYFDEIGETNGRN